MSTILRDPLRLLDILTKEQEKDEEDEEEGGGVWKTGRVSENLETNTELERASMAEML